jgi:pilus assembly protein CpaB
MKRIIPIALALIAFVVVLIFLSPPAQSKVAVAADDLSIGHVLTAEDMLIKSFPKELMPSDVISDPTSVVGKTMLASRSKGDIMRMSTIGEGAISLQPDERAVAITVDNASGLAGLLRPGDKVGINAVISVKSIGNEGTYSKAAIENLPVIYLGGTVLVEVVQTTSV